MAYDPELADRVRAFLPPEARQIPMFGALCFTIGGHMVAGVTRDQLMIPVGREGMADAVARGAREMQMGSRTMTGFAAVSAPDDEDLLAWLPERVAWAAALPPKPAKPVAAKRRLDG